ncbi:MAG: hypothetical protein E7283_03770 [Lachnospiraceae bacterium]|nr:hypothetical protein [Lachnospiraceae bacterium]
MTKIIEIKDKVFRFCAEYDSYLKYLYKFLAAFVLFNVINGSIGFMEKISTMPIALLLALICCLLPQSVTILAAGLLVLLNLYALSLEVALVAFLIFVLLFLLYFRFAPQDGMLFILTPIFFKLGIPYILPIGTGLLRKAYSVTAVICGTVAFYFVDGIHQNITTLGDAVAGGDGGTNVKITVTIGQLLGNKEMFLAVGIFALSAIMVSIIRKLSVDNAWKIAIISGVLVQISGLFAGYLLFNMSDKTAGMIIGNVIAMVLGFVIEFLFMDLDYERTERVQFEDDDYYYFVKAVPKKMVTSTEKTVKHFGPSFMEKRNERKKEEIKADSKKLIAEELDIDEDLLD